MRISPWDSMHPLSGPGYYILRSYEKKFLWFKYWTEPVVVGIASTYEAALDAADRWFRENTMKYPGRYERVYSFPLFPDEYFLRGVVVDRDYGPRNVIMRAAIADPVKYIPTNKV